MRVWVIVKQTPSGRIAVVGVYASEKSAKQDKRLRDKRYPNTFTHTIHEQELEN